MSVTWTSVCSVVAKLEFVFVRNARAFWLASHLRWLKINVRIINCGKWYTNYSFMENSARNSSKRVGCIREVGVPIPWADESTKLIPKSCLNCRLHDLSFDVARLVQIHQHWWKPNCSSNTEQQVSFKDYITSQEYLSCDISPFNCFLPTLFYIEITNF